MPHVAIVGAGFAGLRCADILLQHGVKVTIFEARNRLGGRVHQCYNGGHLVDMGPNWIHGGGENPIINLAEKTSTVTMEPEELHTIFDSDGNRKSEKDSIEVSAELWAGIVDAWKYSNEHHSEIDPDLSLMDYFREEFPKKYPSDAKKVADLLEEASMWGFFVGEDVERQSLRCFSLEEGMDGDNAFVASTYQAILSEVAKRAVQDADIRYGQEIVQVQYRIPEKQDQAVILTTKTGESSSFDEVVITCPLGWLKRNKEAFSPALPIRLTQAINHISYGRLEKLMVTFPSAFWLHNNTTRSSSNSSNSSSTSTPSSPSTSSTPTTTTTQVFTHFTHPTYHPDLSPSHNPARDGKWNQSVVSLAHLPNSTSHPTLLFYIYGPCGTHLTNLLSSHKPHSPTYNSLLHSFSHPFFSRLPNFSTSDPSDTTPTSYLLTQWQNDPFAGYGSYSNFQVGLVDGAEDIRVMRDAGGLSAQGQGIWFAGEHTAPVVSVGTTTGAYRSGDGVARRIIKMYTLAKEGEEKNGAGSTRDE